MNNRWFNVVIAGVLLLALLPGNVASGGPVPVAEVQPLVWEQLQVEGQAEVILILREQADLSGAALLPTKEAKGQFVVQKLREVAGRTQASLQADLTARGVEYQAFYVINAIKLPADRVLVEALAARPEVERIVANPWVKGVPERPAALLEPEVEPKAIEPNLGRVHAPEVWALGYTGQGVVVAGNDTGIDWDHPALINHYRAQQPGYGRHDYNWHDAIHSGGGSCGANSPVPCDDYGHGTHTLGTIVGDDGGSNQIGMAPDAEWIGCRNMNVGWGSPATYLECFEFFLAPYPLNGSPDDGDPSLAPDVINNSWGCPSGEGCDLDTLDAAVQALVEAGIGVVVSSGNSGSGCGSVETPPAIYPQSFTVGAFDHEDDLIASFSSRGPVTYGGQTYVKPDLATPGVSIRSSVPGGWYEDGWSGTSMAAPHVTGAIALLLSAAPGYTGRVDALELALTSTAETKISTQCGSGGPPNSVWGWGILDALAAVQLITSGELHGTVSDATTTAPIPGARVTLNPAGMHTFTDVAGAYSLVVETGTYTVTISALGYTTATLPSVVITETTRLDVTLEPETPLQAEFSSNSPVTLGETMVFTNETTGPPPLTYIWDFGDGVGTSTETHPAYVYAAPGEYTVTLTAESAQEMDIASHPVMVNPPACTPLAGVSLVVDSPAPLYPGEPVLFTAHLAPEDASLPFTYTLDFGDGAPFEPQAGWDSTLVFSHTYASAGAYEASLSAWNCNPAQAVAAVAPLEVVEPSCQPLTGAVLALANPGPFYPGEPVSLTATLNPEGATLPYTFTLDWQDGITSGVSSTNPLVVQHTYSQSGVYAAAFSAWNCSLGEAVTSTLQVSIVAEPCIPLTAVTLTLTSPDPILMGEPASFQATFLPEGASLPVDYSFDFGEGAGPITGTSFSVPIAITQTFTVTGVYTATVELANCELSEPVTGHLRIEVHHPNYPVYLPAILKVTGEPARLTPFQTGR